MALSLMFSLDGTAQRRPSDAWGVQIVSASHTGDKRMSVGKSMPADGTTAAHLLAHGSLGARRSQGGFRAEPMRGKWKLKCVPKFLFRSYVSHTYLSFPRTTPPATGPHTSLNEAHPAVANADFRV
jgi:hypothetical protein